MLFSQVQYRTLAIALHEFAIFFWKELLSCFFPICMIALVAITGILKVPGIPRYDLILIASFAIQWAMIRFGMETKDELKVVCVFHLVGLCLELFKVQQGSWAYPEAAYTKVGGVPLYAGFMYASVASYMCQAWRRLDVDVTGLPVQPLPIAFAALVYGNFFWSHYWIDIRWWLVLLTTLLFWKTNVWMTITTSRRKLPLTLAFFLMGFFIWVAENIQTYLGAWIYPNQTTGWELVRLGKIVSWSLLVIVSFVIVAELKLVKRHLKSSVQGND